MGREHAARRERPGAGPLGDEERRDLAKEPAVVAPPFQARLRGVLDEPHEARGVGEASRHAANFRDLDAAARRRGAPRGLGRGRPSGESSSPKVRC